MSHYHTVTLLHCNMSHCHTVTCHSTRRCEVCDVTSDWPDLHVWQPERAEYRQIEGRQLLLLLLLLPVSRLVVGCLDQVVHHQPAVLPLDDEVGVESDGEVCVGNFGNILDINSYWHSNWLIWRQLELTTKQTLEAGRLWQCSGDSVDKPRQFDQQYWDNCDQFLSRFISTFPS